MTSRLAQASARGTRPGVAAALVAATLLALVACSGCGNNRPFVWASEVAVARESQDAIRPRDQVYVLVRGQEAASGELQVRDDGSIVHSLAGKVEVAGLTAAQAATRLTERLRPMLVEPYVVVSIAATRPSEVSVVGEVREGGRFEIKRGEGVLGALARAGGLTEFADSDGIYVLRQSPKPTRIRFRYDDLTGGDPESLAFQLRDGDIVVVE
jgi:polysaccharide export outer membrane protein